MSAEEALREHGRTNSSLRHFTGPFLSGLSLIPRIARHVNFIILLLTVNFGWARTRCSPSQNFLMIL